MSEGRGRGSPHLSLAECLFCDLIRVMARPTDYTPKLVKKAKEIVAYFDENALSVDIVPSVASFALQLQVSRSTVYEWAKQHKEFSDILEDLLQLQEQKLLIHGLTSKWNPTITKLMLSKHGYRESQDVTTDGKAMPAQVLVRFLGDDEQDHRDTKGV